MALVAFAMKRKYGCVSSTQNSGDVAVDPTGSESDRLPDRIESVRRPSVSLPETTLAHP